MHVEITMIISEIPSYKFCINWKARTDNCFWLNATLRGFEGESSQLSNARGIYSDKSVKPDRYILQFYSRTPIFNAES